MKYATHFSAFVLALALLFILAGCGAPASEPPSATSAREEASADAPQSPAPDESVSSEPEARGETSPTAPEQDNPPQEIPAETSSDTPEPSVGGVSPVCTVSISCAVLLDHVDELSAETAELIPSGGVLLPPTQVTLEPGESAFDVLRRVCRENAIHMEFSETPVYQSAYIEGIGNLYEFDCGSGSGWMYCVNGIFPNYGSSRYTLADGDVLEWLYTCDYGADIGGGAATEAAA